MIRINLLPVEYRRGNRISPKLLATAFGSALAVAASIGWFGIVYFGELGQLEREDVEVTAELSQKKQKATYFDKLQTNKKDYSTRVQTIQDIGKSRRVWSKFMDGLIDVVNNSGDTERHLSWFDSLTVKTDKRLRGATISLPGAVEGGEMAKVANLHQDIELAPFWPDVESKTPPAGKVDFDKSRVPAESFQFQLQIQLKPMVAAPDKGRKGKR
ncbi:MAG: PilN domain-containing protein [Planctomycetota bacterium]